MTDARRPTPTPYVVHKWTFDVVLLLLEGPRRFGELRGRLGSVTPKVLAETLRRLERDGLLHRTEYREIPPRVEYELTTLGRSLEQPIRGLLDWGESRAAEIAAAREAYDRRAAAYAGSRLR